ncbi:hypothetical protein HU200_065785 [Digitaria exilis]|uniref:BTB domain-containing protein n=1 Tax=Digitaria exilis TaxID=1010633 RepID=A0A834ZXK9_9POAL|nr:hypothetical protein HU200_065785 [Digitaria exilis]CAB3483543.1 unnamed protein product [Digitaria exilis]
MEASAAQTTIVDPASAVVEFNVNYEETKYLAAGKAVQSDAISACGLMWRINYYPNGFREGLNRNYIDDYLFISLELLSKSSSVDAIFQVLLVDKDGQPVLFDASRASQFPTMLFRHMGRRTDLLQKYAKNGQIRFQCIIKASHDNSIPVPPSDIVKHLGTLLDSADGKDVSFGIGDETFHAHRAVLAARSPVFKAELLGSMAESTMSSITLHDIAPATFKAMLRFMYTDALPGDDELIEDSPLEKFAPLLAAADRYALERLKLLCAQKLWENLSVDTVGTTLACAERYSCLELKHKCIGFFAVEKNFKKAVLTEGFVRLVQEFPSIIKELRDGAGT